MNKEQIVDKLLDYLFKENNLHYKIPEEYEDKRLLLRGIINLRDPYPISEEILKLEDNLLKLELKEKQITDSKSIKIIKNKMCIYLGDITTLKTEAIVNAANSSLLGCFIPNHNCIDNAIHTYAGIRLRLECNKIMNNKQEKTGASKITKAYNLPSKYIIHTVGPIVNKTLTDKEIEELENCYISCLDLARKNNIREIAFPCISTGVFAFPKDKASEIAVRTVNNYLKKYNESFDKIIFNVFSKEDESYYDKLLRNKKTN